MNMSSQPHAPAALPTGQNRFMGTIVSLAVSTFWRRDQSLILPGFCQCSTALDKLTVSSPSQEIVRLLWNPTVYHPVHNSPPPDPTLSQINPLSQLQFPLNKIPLITAPPSGLLPPTFPTVTLTLFVIFSIHATCAAHLILRH